MAIFLPFKAIRPKNSDTARNISCLPYDVMNTEEARAMAGKNAQSFLHVIRSEIDFPDDTDPYTPLVYQKAKDNLSSLIKSGALIQDSAPCYYIYRQSFLGRTQCGVCALASVDEYENGVIKRHEHTLAEKELDRINHFSACLAQTEPVFFMHEDNSELSEAISLATKREPDYYFTSEDEIIHSLWAESRPQIIEQSRSAFEGMQSLYIADGHHRTASVAKVRSNLIKEEKPVPQGANYIMAVSFPVSQVNIMDYNRLASDTGKFSKSRFIRELEKDFEVIKEQGQIRASVPHEFVLYIDSKYYRLIAKPESFDSADPVGSLDAAILQKNLFDKLLGIKDPSASKRLSFAGGIRGYKYLTDKVDKGEAAFAVMLCPVSAGDIINVADCGMIMPPKSTWFEPKLRSGLFINKY